MLVAAPRGRDAGMRLNERHPSFRAAPQRGEDDPQYQHYQY